MWKADIDAAYRRIPSCPEHRHLLWVLVMCQGTVWTSRHTALPFGCVASVHAWHSIGGLLCHIGRKLLKLPLLRYVDDLFSADRPSCAAHAMSCFARVVRAIMGASAIQERKLKCDSPLDVLGVTVSITRACITVFPSADKVEKWCGQLQRIEKTLTLHAGEAGKIAGRLGFAAQHAFSKLGRAMLRPFYRQQYAPLPSGRLGPLLRLAVKWWLHALTLPLQNTVDLCSLEKRVVDLFCDARGQPPRVAAVLIDEQREITYTDWAPSQAVMQTFAARKDSQIMGLELLAILVGLQTFASRLSGLTVRIWTDNTGGENALRAAAAKCEDHNLIVHAIWLMAAKAGIGLWIERVGSHDNISDEPSRESYELLEAVGAKWEEPRLPKNICHPQKWAEWKFVC